MSRQLIEMDVVHGYLSPLQKVKNDEWPLRLQDFKAKKELNISFSKCVILSVFVPLCQKYTFRSGVIIDFFVATL